MPTPWNRSSVIERMSDVCSRWIEDRASLEDVKKAGVLNNDRLAGPLGLQQTGRVCIAEGGAGAAACPERGRGEAVVACGGGFTGRQPAGGLALVVWIFAQQQRRDGYHCGV